MVEAEMERAQVAFAESPTVEEYVRLYFADAPILAEIAHCESRFRQYNSYGDVIRGEENSQDVGVMQINEHFHLQTANKLGINLYSLEGNVAYARYLYEKEGVTPWKASSACWENQRIAMK